MSQEIKYIDISDLVLWSENPRDPISKDASDQDIVDQALMNVDGTWDIDKFAKSMGETYDFSELPTVVYEEGKPIVYDGNRRIILGKIFHKYVKTSITINNIPHFPKEIPCNVCSKDIALKSILRKHGESGSWKPLERDYFIAKYNLGDKSDFLIIDENTGVISQNPILNQGFVRKEILNPSNLVKLGLKVENNRLYTQHTEIELRSIFDDIIDKIVNKEITTRTSRGKSYDVLSPQIKNIIENNRITPFSILKRPIYEIKPLDSTEGIVPIENSNKPISQNKRTRRISEKDIPFFGKKLLLKAGKVNNLYCDILELYDFYKTRKLSKSFTIILRMSLRLLCETATNTNKSSNIKEYIFKYFDDAKKTLDQNQKTLLSSQNVNKESLTQLLQTGAHAYESSLNFEQTVAISIILGAMLSISHGK